jgi:hypothetical protein
MRGGSQATLVETDEGFFVVKWVQNSQHRRILINEAMCSALLARLGIASPQWACIQVDQVFLDNNPEIRITRRRGHTAVEPGRHFGSRFPGSPDHNMVFDYLPSSIFQKVPNRWDFLKIHVFNLWIDNRDTTQAVYSCLPGRGLRVEMIDHGHTLGFDGVGWGTQSASIHGIHPQLAELALTADATNHYQRAIAAIQEVTRDDLAKMLELVPPEWIGEDGASLARQLDGLVDRSQRLPALLADAMVYMQQQRASGHRELERNFTGDTPTRPLAFHVIPHTALSLANFNGCGLCRACD